MPPSRLVEDEMLRLTKRTPVGPLQIDKLADVSVEPKSSRFNRNGLGSTDFIASVQPKPLRFNRNLFGSTETVSVEPTPFRLNRHYFG